LGHGTANEWQGHERRQRRRAAHGVFAAAVPEENLERVRLSDALDKKPAELSAGMRQRVGNARAFALDPKSCSSTSRSACSTRSRASSCSRC
jgi:ABC-type proline/glycine betaine transport system ATPase subunit